MICLTKGVDESIDLTEKLKDLTQGTMISRIHVISGKCRLLLVTNIKCTYQIGQQSLFLLSYSIVQERRNEAK